MQRATRTRTAGESSGVRNDVDAKYRQAGPPRVDIDAITGMQDPVERNRAITRGYHKLSHQMGDLVGKDNANWMTFGQYASAGAGRVIRGEEGRTQRLFAGDAKKHTADGNKAIFKDIAPHYQDFIQTFSKDTSWKKDPAKGKAMIEKFASDDSLARKPGLQSAFRSYYDAMVLHQTQPHTATNDKKRAEAVLKGNLQIAAHEQRFADRYIDKAIPDGWAGPVGGAFNLLPGKDVRHRATDRIKIGIGDETLKVSEDVPRPKYLGGRQYPRALENLKDPYFERAIKGWDDQHLDDTEKSNAKDWQDYGERMGYIYHFFRSYQQQPDAFKGPPELR